MNRTTPPDAARVAAASAAWVWIPEQARTIETDDFLLVRYPDWFHHQVELARISPAGDVYASRGGVVDETLDVLALDLAAGAPDLGEPATGVEVRWVDDLQGLRDFVQIGVEVFGGKPTPEEELEGALATERETRAGGRGGHLVAYDGGRPVGAGGVSIEDGDARLWGGGALEDVRGRGVYRALLAERLAEGLRQGAGLAIVKGRIATSGPILRRAGFHVYGREISCTIPL